MGEYQREVLAKTPGLYQVPKLRNLRQKNYGPTDRQTDKQTESILWSIEPKYVIKKQLRVHKLAGEGEIGNFVTHSAQMHEPDVVVEGEGVANDEFDVQALGG